MAKIDDPLMEGSPTTPEVVGAPKFCQLKVSDQSGWLDKSLWYLKTQVGLDNLSEHDSGLVKHLIDKRDGGDRNVTAAQATEVLLITQRSGADFRPAPAIANMRRAPGTDLKGKQIYALPDKPRN